MKAITKVFTFKDTLLEAAYINKKRNEFQRLLTEIEKHILNYERELVSNRELGEANYIKTLLLGKKNELISELEDLKDAVPEPIKQELVNIRNSIYQAKEEILKIFTTSHAHEFLASWKKNFPNIKRDLNGVLLNHINERMAIPTLDDINSIREKLKLKHSTFRLTRESVQIYRRVWHMFGGASIALCYMSEGISKPLALFILGIITLLIGSVDLGRLWAKDLNEKIITDFSLLIREKEKHNLSAMTYFLIGSWLSILLFSKPIAVISVLFLAFGDPIASIVGIKYAKTKSLWGGKSIEGSFACFSACFLSSFIVLTIYYPFGFFKLFFFSIACGLVGALAEIVPLKLDDNFIIPIFSGIFISFII
jgi:dolichol kinase